TTDKEPLVINFVAHSHGGNVVLEVLRRIKGPIQIGQIALLGTPLISVQPSFRLIRLILSYAFLSFFFFMSSSSLLFFVLAISGYHLVNADPDSFLGPDLTWHLIWIGPLLIFVYGAIFSFLAWLADKIWWIIGRLFMVITDRGKGQAYGPSPKSLSSALEGKKAFLLTSRLDEADLALHLGAAPQTLYNEWVAQRSFPIRTLALIFIRPAFIGLIFRALEIGLEHFVLGLPWYRLLFFDYEMVQLEKGREYTTIQSIDVSEDLVPALKAKQQVDPKSNLFRIPVQAPKDEPAPGAGTLRRALEEAGKDLIAQIRLRHSTYYESDLVIEKIADEICQEQ
ncbi:hypothetical protein ACFLSH_02075, partial [Bacteroidota bacterium]